jgi:hypothetical protein
LKLKYLESIFNSLSKSYSLNYHLKSHLHKNHFLNFSLSNSFSICRAYSRKLFSSSIFGQWKIRNKRWLYLDNHLKKLLDDSFSPKYLFLIFRNDHMSQIVIT